MLRGIWATIMQDSGALKFPLWLLASTVGATIDREKNEVTFPEKMGVYTLAADLEFGIAMFSTEVLAHEFVAKNHIRDMIVIPVRALDDLYRIALIFRDD